MTREYEALASQRTIDLTTIGRKTGLPRRIEIWWFGVDGRLIISGTPGRRDWLANIHANPAVTVHVGGQSLPGRALPVQDIDFRKRFFTRPSTSWYSTQSELERLVRYAPMVEIVFDEGLM